MLMIVMLAFSCDFDPDGVNTGEDLLDLWILMYDYICAVLNYLAHSTRPYLTNLCNYITSHSFVWLLFQQNCIVYSHSPAGLVRLSFKTRRVFIIRCHNTARVALLFIITGVTLDVSLLSTPGELECNVPYSGLL
jgi:hypothetical protein